MSLEFILVSMAVKGTVIVHQMVIPWYYLSHPETFAFVLQRNLHDCIRLFKEYHSILCLCPFKVTTISMYLYNSICNYSNSGYVSGTVTMLFLVLFAFRNVTVTGTTQHYVSTSVLLPSSYSKVCIFYCTFRLCILSEHFW